MPKVTYLLPQQCMDPWMFYIVLGEDADPGVGRYKMLSLLGEGGFSKVVEAWDREEKKRCAVKIVSNRKRDAADTAYEIRAMENVLRADPGDLYGFSRIERHFVNAKGHVCIVMPRYGPSLYDYVHKHGGMEKGALAEVIFQLGCALDLMHRKMGCAHTDLKPENVVLEAPETEGEARSSYRVRLADLGGTVDNLRIRGGQTALVSTIYYRAPEVALRLGWSFDCDMWSMGCLIYEVYAAKVLFDAHGDLELLNMMVKRLGGLPEGAAGRCPEGIRSTFFDDGGMLCPVPDWKRWPGVGRSLEELVDDPVLLSLLRGLLDNDRSRRYTAAQMAVHPYVLENYPGAAGDPRFTELSAAAGVFEQRKPAEARENPGVGKPKLGEKPEAGKPKLGEKPEAGKPKLEEEKPLARGQNPLAERQEPAGVKKQRWTEVASSRGKRAGRGEVLQVGAEHSEVGTFDFIVRFWVNGTGRCPDCYLAREVRSGALVCVKGPYREGDVTPRLELSADEWYRANGLPSSGARAISLYPDRWPEGVPVGLRNSVPCKERSVFVVSDYPEGETATRECDTAKWGIDTVLENPSNWRPLEMWAGAAEETKTSYVLALFGKYILGVCDWSDRNFRLCGGTTVSAVNNEDRGTPSFRAELKVKKYGLALVQSAWARNSLLLTVRGWAVPDGPCRERQRVLIGALEEGSLPA